MIEELSEWFIPDKILFRENQKEVVERVFKNFKNGEDADNLFVSGYSGVGKTLLMNIIIQDKSLHKYINAKDYNTTRRLFSALQNSKKQMTCDIVQEFIESMKNNPKMSRTNFIKIRIFYFFKF